MEIRSYDNTDFPELKNWFSLRGKEVIEECLPQFGFIAPGIAAGFLMQTDCKVGILEPFISNPNTTKEQRDEAINIIMFNLINLAKLMEFKFIFGISTSESMIERSLKHGFHIQDKSTVVVRSV